MIKLDPGGFGPVAPGLIQLDDRTLVSVRLARSSAPTGKYRAVALSVLQARHRVPLSSSQTVGYGSDPQSALDACLDRVRVTLSDRKTRPRRLDRRPEPTV